MNKSFFILDNYRGLKPKLNCLIDDFNSRGSLIKHSRNTIKKIKIDNLILNIKRFKRPNFFNKIIYTFFRLSKAQRSFNYARRLIDLGILTPEPICYYNTYKSGLIYQSYYMCENVDYDYDMEFVFENIKLDGRDELIKRFTYFTHNLHENGIMFLDHSRSNTLIKKNNNSYSFYLIDLNRMKFKSLSINERLRNFKRLKMSDEVLEKVSEYYSDLVKIDKQLIFKKIKKYSENFENNRKLRKKIKKFINF